MIKLNDLFKIKELIDYKIRLNIAIGSNAENMKPAQDVYFENTDEYKNACAWNGKSKCLNRKYVISFAEIKNKCDLWLFTGVFKVNNYDVDLKRDKCGFLEHSNLTPVDEFPKYCGRLIVKFHKTTHAYVLKAENIIEDMELFEILNEEFNDEYFKGYENVDLTFTQLQHIFQKQGDWKTALENSKAVYLIRDDYSGNMYVGSAYGDEMLWQRWKAYAKNGHGGNKDLKEIVNKYGINYVKDHFHYSILEHFVSSVSDQQIIDRESFWKKILLTGKFGYNNN